MILHLLGADGSFAEGLAGMCGGPGRLSLETQG